MGQSHRVARTGSIQAVQDYFNQNPQRIDERDENGRTPLVLALADRRPEIAAVLLDLGAAPDKADRYGHTPLMVAARFGLIEPVKRLIKLGADVRAEDSVDGISVLEWASMEEQHEVVELLRRHLENPRGG